MSTRRNLYRAARLLGDLQAAQKGPGALAKRRGRALVYRGVNGALGRLLRRVGLS